MYQSVVHANRAVARHHELLAAGHRTPGLRARPGRRGPARPSTPRKGRNDHH